MSHSNVFRLTAILGLIFGLPLLLAPNGLMAIYGSTPLNSTGVYNSMLLGAALLALAMADWGASRMAAEHTRALVLANLVMFVLMLVVGLYRQLTVPETPVSAWVNVALFLVMAMLFGQLLARGSAAVHPPGEPVRR